MHLAWNAYIEINKLHGPRLKLEFMNVDKK
jgi:hypothetical protein